MAEFEVTPLIDHKLRNIAKEGIKYIENYMVFKDPALNKISEVEIIIMSCIGKAMLVVSDEVERLNPKI